MTKFDTEVPDVPITSPNIDTSDSRVAKTVKDFSGMLTMDLTDDEIAQAFRITAEVNQRYRYLQATRANLEAQGDELVYRLAEEASILSKYDPVPLASGGSPEIEFIGKISGDPVHRYGFDHEKKTWEVQRATDKGESFYGEEKVRGRLGE